MSDVKKVDDAGQHSMEWKSFFIICAVFFPLLAVAIVGGYGFIVWMLQVFFLGPPGAHG
ncbi:periplasmic nitrate reductase, NapE protein [Vibrio hippocampi]|uniref:Trimethylamine N-oxide reductase system protein TorE n=1 Tax=Vibrio hippocampi TaxID=654686 RepID=A0ABN8DIM2_9VIBR|nr:periplasmic nitrate reductase, NapE protein [Vibrio hippocampi]CAH0526385.1 hypothetical protein VHP8226_01779 [Vibrio hippocampi]